MFWKLTGAKQVLNKHMNHIRASGQPNQPEKELAQAKYCHGTGWNVVYQYHEIQDDIEDVKAQPLSRILLRYLRVAAHQVALPVVWSAESHENIQRPEEWKQQPGHTLRGIRPPVGSSMEP